MKLRCAPVDRGRLRLLALAAAGIAWPASAAQPPLTVGVLLPGTREDRGWMASGHAGVVAAQAAHGERLRVQLLEGVTGAQMEPALEQLALRNALVIGIGGQTQAAIQRVAPRHPSTRFSIVGGTRSTPVPNIAGYDVRQAEIAFVAGAAAALLSRSGRVGFIAGPSFPAIANAGREFGNGARYIDPKVQVRVDFTGDFEDVARARQAAQAGIAEGVDLHHHILNLGLRGLEEAARAGGTRLIGSYTARCGTDPLYLAYSVTGVGFQVQYAINEMLAGHWRAGYKPFGLAMGPRASDLVVCGDATAVRAKVEAVKKELLAGRIRVSAG